MKKTTIAMLLLPLAFTGCGQKDYMEAVKVSNIGLAQEHHQATTAQVIAIANAMNSARDPAASAVLGAALIVAMTKDAPHAQVIQAPADGPEYIKALAPLALTAAGYGVLHDALKYSGTTTYQADNGASVDISGSLNEQAGQTNGITPDIEVVEPTIVRPEVVRP